MPAYEFYAKLENGFIRVPKKYRDKIKSGIKVILLEENIESPTESKRTDLLSPISIDTRGWRFDKEEANER